MKQNNIHLILLVSFVVIVLSATIACSKHEDALEGSWLLTYDPDAPNGPLDDMLVFRGGNQVDFSDSKGVYLSCTYEEAGQKVILTCNIKGKTKTLEMEFSADDPKVMVNPSGAEYTRQ
jgi:hypothetical protein